MFVILLYITLRHYGCGQELETDAWICGLGRFRQRAADLPSDSPFYLPLGHLADERLRKTNLGGAAAYIVKPSTVFACEMVTHLLPSMCIMS